MNNSHFVALVFGLSICYFCPAEVATEKTSDFGKASLVERITRANVFPEPLRSVGHEPLEAESQDLLAALDLVSSNRSAALEKMEDFISGHPTSAWVPSLRANLASYYRDSGRYSLALKHWEAAWQATRNIQEGNGKNIADYTLVNWTSLLASLGRTGKLEKIFEQANGRTLTNVAWQKRFNDTIEALAIMKRTPGMAYKCGTFALAQMGRRRGLLDAKEFKKLVDIPSPSTGFSMTFLNDCAKRFNLDVVPVFRADGDQNIVVPSVVHWKQNHYAAIIDKKGDFYHVLDPTFGTDKWINGDIINAEASGHFFVPSNRKPGNWELMAADEMNLVFGKGSPNTKPPPPPPCPENTCCPPGGPTGGGNGGNGGNRGKGDRPRAQTESVVASSGCSSCGGMAAWRVAEPYIELWVFDKPLSYNPSRGNAFSVSVDYHQNETRPINTNIYNFGPYWNSDLLTYLEVTDSMDDPTFINYEATLFARGGGRIKIFILLHGTGDAYSHDVRTNFVWNELSRIFHSIPGCE